MMLVLLRVVSIFFLGFECKEVVHTTAVRCAHVLPKTIERRDHIAVCPLIIRVGNEPEEGVEVPCYLMIKLLRCNAALSKSDRARQRLGKPSKNRSIAVDAIEIFIDILDLLISIVQPLKMLLMTLDGRSKVLFADLKTLIVVRTRGFVRVEVLERMGMMIGIVVDTVDLTTRLMIGDHMGAY